MNAQEALEFMHKNPGKVVVCEQCGVVKFKMEASPPHPIFGNLVGSKLLTNFHYDSWGVPITSWRYFYEPSYTFSPEEGKEDKLKELENKQRELAKEQEKLADEIRRLRK